jgi:hypothetical protein
MHLYRVLDVRLWNSLLRPKSTDRVGGDWRDANYKRNFGYYEHLTKLDMAAKTLNCYAGGGLHETHIMQARTPCKFLNQAGRLYFRRAKFEALHTSALSGDGDFASSDSLSVQGGREASSLFSGAQSSTL